MYCSRCAAQISEDLNFCSSCGERVNKNGLADGNKAHNDVLDTVATTTIFIGVGGMLFLVGLVAVLLDKTIPTQLVVLLVGMYLAAWFGIMYKLINQITKIVDFNLNERKRRPADAAAPIELPPPRTARLEAQTQEPASVTEQTTRGLEPTTVMRNW